MAIRRALLSVSDKTGLLELAHGLVGCGVSLLSTGGTQRFLADNGVPVDSVESYTESPEVMQGRVKTLHPRIHGGLLARPGVDDADLQRLGATPLDLVIVNLYPFAQTLADPSRSFADLVEKIDIGGPSMLRSAAKNHARVTVVCDPADYDTVLEQIRSAGDVQPALRQWLAAKVFTHTASYDAGIATWLSAQGESDGHPRSRFFCLEKAYSLRYGENPHQEAAFYREIGAAPGTLAAATSCGEGAKELSYNNLVDVEAALEAVRDFDQPAAVVIKHATPSGVSTMPQLADAYRAARDADAMSAFGGIVALNRPVDLATAEAIAESFVECIAAPSFSDQALQRLHQKKNLRLLATGTWLGPDYQEITGKRISGGFVLQDRDTRGAQDVTDARTVTQRTPNARELPALGFAWKVCKHVRSNAIVLASRSYEGYATVGIGGGQTARVAAVRQAIHNAGERAAHSVLASDAFFPFPDGVELAAAAGITAIVQPGGSKADADVIRTADAAGIAMLFTGVRHFRH